MLNSLVLNVSWLSICSAYLFVYNRFLSLFFLNISWLNESMTMRWLCGWEDVKISYRLFLLFKAKFLLLLKILILTNLTDFHRFCIQSGFVLLCFVYYNYYYNTSVSCQTATCNLQVGLCSTSELWARFVFTWCFMLWTKLTVSRAVHQIFIYLVFHCLRLTVSRIVCQVFIYLVTCVSPFVITMSRNVGHIFIYLVTYVSPFVMTVSRNVGHIFIYLATCVSPFVMVMSRNVGHIFIYLVTCVSPFATDSFQKCGP